MFLLEIFTSLIIIYLSILVFLRIKLFKSRLISKVCINCCPKCHNPLERIKSNFYNKFKNFITLDIFQFHRFYCNKCNWNGLLAKYSKKLQT
jgi:uncharacterized protein YbaR (Trm112 family)